MNKSEIQQKVHKQIVDNCDKVCSWFERHSKGLEFPIYASFDVRDSGQKIVPVDANIFPAGFNNICPADKSGAEEILKKYLDKHYPQAKRIALLTEEHTSNGFYWENVYTIAQLLKEAGRPARICIPRKLENPIQVTSATGRELTVYSAEPRDGEIYVDGEKVDLLVCNNDFSDSYEDWAKNLTTSINPPNELGWYRRRKYSFFQKYNDLVSEFADIIQIDAKYLQVDTEMVDGVDVDDADKREALANKVDELLARLKAQYEKMEISSAPFCFLKNNAGTYGMAVVQAHSGDEIRAWNNKTRKKMKAAKGGREVTELIVQEGIPTMLREEGGGSAEPCIYTVGGELVGGFLRMHSEKGPDESLNSPGVVFKRLCIADLADKMSDCPMENVYGWIAKLGALAIALEARDAGVNFRGYVGA